MLTEEKSSKQEIRYYWEEETNIKVLNLKLECDWGPIKSGLYNTYVMNFKMHPKDVSKST